MHIDNGSLATITFALIKKRAIRVSFVGFGNDSQLAKSFTYNAFHGVIIPLEFVILSYLMAYEMNNRRKIRTRGGHLNIR